MRNQGSIILPLAISSTQAGQFRKAVGPIPDIGHIPGSEKIPLFLKGSWSLSFNILRAAVRQAGLQSQGNDYLQERLLTMSVGVCLNEHVQERHLTTLQDCLIQESEVHGLIPISDQSRYQSEESILAD